MLWLIGLAALQLWPVALASLTRQVKLGGIHYFLPPTEAWRFVGWDEKIAPDAAELIPLTVVTIDGLSGANAVADTLRRYGEEDDVWSPDFAEGTSVSRRVQKLDHSLANSALLAIKDQFITGFRRRDKRRADGHIQYFYHLAFFWFRLREQGGVRWPLLYPSLHWQGLPAV